MVKEYYNGRSTGSLMWSIELCHLNDQDEPPLHIACHFFKIRFFHPGQKGVMQKIPVFRGKWPLYQSRKSTQKASQPKRSMVYKTFPEETPVFAMAAGNFNLKPAAIGTKYTNRHVPEYSHTNFSDPLNHTTPIFEMDLNFDLATQYTSAMFHVCIYWHHHLWGTCPPPHGA